MLVPPTPDMLNIFNSWKACFAKMVGQMSFTLVQVGLCGWRGLQGLDVCSDTNPNTAHLHVQRSCAVHLEKSHNMQWNQRVQGPCILYHLVQCYWGQEPYSKQDTDSSHHFMVDNIVDVREELMWCYTSETLCLTCAIRHSSQTFWVWECSGIQKGWLSEASDGRLSILIAWHG